MRQVLKPQMELGELPIGAIRLDPKSRDDIPKILAGLQHIYITPELREQVFAILREALPERPQGGKVSAALGRPGLAQWRILVLGVLRLGLDADYDRLQELANQHGTIRQMLGHGDWGDLHRYEVQTLKDNLRLFTPEVLDRINQVVVRAGHALVKKSPEESLRGRGDSFVVETDVHYPTDLSLLQDAVRKAIKAGAEASARHGLDGWRQHAYHLRQFKRQYRTIQGLKRSGAKDTAKRQAREQRIERAYREHLDVAVSHLERVNRTVEALAKLPEAPTARIAELQGYAAHAERQIDQIRRRVLEGEAIPHAEKVFSIFQPHTEWIQKGKAGVPVELGLRVALVEDQHRFILHHQVMEKQTDDQVAVDLVREGRKRFPELRAISYDQGFHSPANRQALEAEVDLVAMRKKGRLSAADREREAAPEFVAARRQHSAVESAINGLEHFGLDLCPDHWIDGFKRYVALAVVARNLHRLGVVVHAKEARPPASGKPPPLKKAA